MKFNFENGEWVQGEKTKKSFNRQEFFDKWKWCFIVAIIDLGIWWWHWGFHLAFWRAWEWVL